MLIVIRCGVMFQSIRDRRDRKRKEPLSGNQRLYRAKVIRLATTGDLGLPWLKGWIVLGYRGEEETENKVRVVGKGRAVGIQTHRKRGRFALWNLGNFPAVLC